MRILQQLGHPCPLNTFLVIALLSSADFFLNLFFFEKSLSGISSMSKSLDQDQAQRFVRPDLGLNDLQKLSADITRR